MTMAFALEKGAPQYPERHFSSNMHYKAYFEVLQNL